MRGGLRQALTVTAVVATLPLALWCYAEGGLSVVRIAGVYLVTALLLGSGVLWWAWRRRSSASP